MDRAIEKQLKFIHDDVHGLKPLVEEVLKAVRKVAFDFAIEVQVKGTSQGARMLDISLTTEQQVKVTAKPVTLKDKPVSLDGPLTWTPNNADVVVTPVEGEENSVIIAAPDEAGDRVIVVTGDADLGEGVEHISTTVNLHVNHSRAVNLGLTSEPPTEKPDPA